MKRINKIMVSGLILLVLLPGVFAVKDLLVLQGSVKDSDGIPVDDGNLTVEIYDQPTGGTLQYNSTTDYINQIQNGEFSINVGNGTNELDLIMNGIYYLDLAVNNVDLDFKGQERQQFQSAVGNITNLSNTVYLSGGNVGINTTAPTSTLHVDGDLNVTGSAYGSFGAMTLIGQDSGTNTTTTPTTVSTIPVSGLTAKDTLLVFITGGSRDQQTGAPSLYHVTDDDNISTLYVNDPVPAGTRFGGRCHVVQAHGNATGYQGLCFVPAKQSQFAYNASTAWTGSWTIGLRHDGVTSGGTFDFVWSVYKLAGQ